MNSGELLHSIASHFEKASAKSVYGEPVTAEGKVIVPVAKVRYGFGAGSGSSRSRHGEGAPDEGGGGGGGLQVVPCGVVEVSAAGTRFIPIGQGRAIAAAAAAGVLLGMCLERWRARKAIR